MGKKLTLIIVIGFVLRVFFSIYSLLQGINYYEYGVIVQNIINGNGYSYTYLYFSEPLTVKSAYMPPGYPFFILPFFLISCEIIRDFLFLLTQNALSCITIYLIYRYTVKLFNEKVALVSALIFAVLPDFVFIANSATPTTVFHLLLMIFFLTMENIKHASSIKLGIWLGFLTTIIGYFRGEFFIFAGFVWLYLFFNGSRKLVFVSVFVSVLLLSPWIVRNYQVFNEFVPISNSFGLNFYRGHNIYGMGDWGDEEIIAKLEQVKHLPNFETKMSNIFLQRSIEMIKENPSMEFSNTFFKLVHLWLISPIGFSAMHLISLFIWLLLLPFGIWGIIKTFSIHRFKFLYLYIIYFCLNAILFFVLVRYQIMFKIALIPFIGYGITEFTKYFEEKFNKRVT